MNILPDNGQMQINTNATAVDSNLQNGLDKEQKYECPHTSKYKIAKNMCYNCYHSKGKTKKASKCEHHDRLHYANGYCKDCYLKINYQKRK